MFAPSRLIHVSTQQARLIKSLQARNVDHDILSGKVIEDVALGLVAKSYESSQSHGKTS